VRCEIQSCALWPFRMGRNPNRAGIGWDAGGGFNIENPAKKETDKKRSAHCTNAKQSVRSDRLTRG
jgi:hypothetical protein